MMTCRAELGSEEAWRAYLASATEQDAGAALNEVLRLTVSFARQSQTVHARMGKFLDEGKAIYAERFGRKWAPF